MGGGSESKYGGNDMTEVHARLVTASSKARSIGAELIASKERHA